MIRHEARGGDSAKFQAAMWRSINGTRMGKGKSKKDTAPALLFCGRKVRTEGEGERRIARFGAGRWGLT
jgi:hypothetical protein